MGLVSKFRFWLYERRLTKYYLEKNFEEMIKLLKHEDEMVRVMAAIYAAKQEFVPKVIKPLFEALWDKSDRVQRIASERLYILIFSSVLNTEMYKDLINSANSAETLRITIHGAISTVISRLAYDGRELNPGEAEKVSLIVTNYFKTVK